MRRLALVTGASAGIGAAFARTYAAAGYDVALTARRGDRLETLAAEIGRDHGVEAYPLAADLADPAAPERLMQEIAARGRVVDALVNNAGYGRIGPYAASDWAEHRAFLQVMTVAVAELAHRALPGMAERRFGRIINVASLLALTPAIPDHGLYSAAKAFVVKFSEGLHLETLGTGVHVTAVCPGLTRSEFHTDPALRAPTEPAPTWLWMRAEAVAEQGFEASEANRPVCVTGAANKAVAAAAHLLPPSWGLAMVARRYRKP
ncbi:MAG: dehydrogenase [Caulobacterales bacterium 32-69-10]|nr:MAG: dehydrogenase [Caulobacterales bacterium 32-69-10]